MADHRNDGLSASGSVQARSESGDVATSLSAVSEQVQEVSSVVLVAEGVGAMSGRATDIYGTPSGTSSEGEGVPEEELVSLKMRRMKMEVLENRITVASEEAEVDPGVDRMEAGMAVVLFGIFQCRRWMLRVKGR